MAIDSCIDGVELVREQNMSHEDGTRLLGRWNRLGGLALVFGQLDVTNVDEALLARAIVANNGHSLDLLATEAAAGEVADEGVWQLDEAVERGGSIEVADRREEVVAGVGLSRRVRVLAGAYSVVVPGAGNAHG
jgi:hypothetical protein